MNQPIQQLDDLQLDSVVNGNIAEIKPKPFKLANSEGVVRLCLVEKHAGKLLDDDLALFVDVLTPLAGKISNLAAPGEIMVCLKKLNGIAKQRHWSAIQFDIGENDYRARRIRKALRGARMRTTFLFKPKNCKRCK